jgi:diguanylate cyclase (GGDEF)-like protein
MGRTVGVIHATGEPYVLVDDSTAADLSTLSKLTGARIGLLRVMAETQLQAATDSLTGLLNRRSLENKVRVLRASRMPVVVAMADLDHFKELNDKYGHETGDRALRLFAQVLRNSLRQDDLVARYGGEEFALVLPSYRAEDARIALDRVRVTLKDAIANAGLPRFTASFGIIEAAEEDEDLAQLLAHADVALFEAKHQGRDRVVVHDRGGHQVSPQGCRPDAAPVAGGERQANEGAANGNGHARRNGLAPEPALDPMPTEV